MKIRDSFIGNSSSSSFMIRAEDKYKVDKFDIKTYSIELLITKLEVISEIVNTILDENSAPYFITGDLNYLKDNMYLNALKKAQEKEFTYVTEPVDRDYSPIIKYNFDLFEGDL